jgi:O-antigen biosynthesis protein
MSMCLSCDAMSELAICVLFFERWRQTAECIRAFGATGRPVYVLDNGSAEASGEELRAAVQGVDVRWSRSPANLGVARGRNCLLRESVEPYLLFVDSDIVPQEESAWDGGLLRAIADNPDVEAFIPSLFERHEDAWYDYEEIRLDRRSVEFLPLAGRLDTNVFPGGASLVSRTLFDRLGAYDEALFVGMEDQELALRALRAGQPIRARLVPDVALVHDHRPVDSAADHHAVAVRYDPAVLERSRRHVSRVHSVEFALPRDWAFEQARSMGVTVAAPAGDEEPS